MRKLKLISWRMQVIEVINFSEGKTFLKFPKVLYHDNPDWVCPLDKDINEIFDRKLNPYFDRGDAKRWLLLNSEGTPIGRIAAFYTFIDTNNIELKTGGFGFFECINDQNAANLLFETAKNWLTHQGFYGMDGPRNFGEKDKFWGLMVQGFKNPSYQENFNFPYYQSLMENYGFKRIFEQTTSEIGCDVIKIDRIDKISSRVLRNPKYRFEHFRKSQLKKFAMDFIEIYNQAWAHREDFVPFTFERIESSLISFIPIMLEEAIWFVYVNNEPAGFYVNVIDVNQIFKHLNGKLDFFGKLKFLWFKKFGNINRIRGIVFGVIPKYQNLGLEVGLIMKVHDALKKFPNIQSSELSWIGDFNPKMHSLFNAVGAKTTKIHYTYRLIWTEETSYKIPN